MILVYDGGCPFCRVFALRTELAGGIEGLQIRDGRADHALRRAVGRVVEPQQSRRIGRDDLAFVVDRHEVGERVRVELFDAQGNALALHVHSQHHGFDFLSLFEVANSGFAGFVPR